MKAMSTPSDEKCRNMPDLDIRPITARARDGDGYGPQHIDQEFSPGDVN